MSNSPWYCYDCMHSTTGICQEHLLESYNYSSVNNTSNVETVGKKHYDALLAQAKGLIGCLGQGLYVGSFDSQQLEDWLVLVEKSISDFETFLKEQGK